MRESVKAVLAQYETRQAAESELMRTLSAQEMSSRRDDFLIPIGPETGTVLNVLIKGARARSILEIGTSYGNSTVWLAEAAEQIGGKVVTLELAAKKVDYARASIERAGLGAFVDFRIGNALDLLATLDGPFDFVLLDLWKDLYIPCFDLFYPKLSPGAFVAADNMLLPEYARPHALAYRQHIRNTELDTLLLPVGSGVELSRRR